MSVTVASKVFWTDIPVLTYIDKFGNIVKIGKSTSKFVLLAIADNADDFGENSYQSFETIATKTSMERRTVIRAVRALIGNGYLKTAGLSRYGTNNYVITMSKLGEQPPARAKVGRPKTSDSDTDIGDSRAETSDSRADIGDSEAKIGDVESPESSINHPDPSLKEVIEKANKTVDTLLEAERLLQQRSPWMKWIGRENIPEPLRPLLDEFVRLTGIKPSKRDLTGWLMEGQEWLTAGLTIQDIQRAHEYANRDGGFLVSSPMSLTKTAKAIHAKKVRVEVQSVEATAAMLAAREAEQKPFVPPPETARAVLKSYLDKRRVR